MNRSVRSVNCGVMGGERMRRPSPRSAKLRPGLRPRLPALRLRGRRIADATPLPIRSSCGTRMMATAFLSVGLGLLWTGRMGSLLNQASMRSATLSRRASMFCVFMWAPRRARQTMAKKRPTEIMAPAQNMRLSSDMLALPRMCCSEIIFG